VAYAVSVSLLGAVTVLVLAVSARGLFFGDPRLWLFAALALVLELLPINVARRSGLDRVTASSAFAFAILLLFGPLAAVLAYASASLIADAIGRIAPLKALFNAAQYAIALAVAGGVIISMGVDLPVVSVASDLPAVAAGAATFLAVNHVLAGVAAALLTREPLARYLVTDLRFQLISSGFVLALAPVVTACAEASIALVPLCLLPILAIYVGAQQSARDAHRALHDALTGLPNRVLLNERLERELGRRGAAVVLMILDLDDFKAVNDTLGHAFGDRLLQDVSARLGAVLRPADVVARLGGDEFAVMIAGQADAAAGLGAAERLVAALDEPFELDGIVLQVRASVGLACYPDHGGGPDELLRCADIALYCAKAGQRAIELFTAAHDHHSVDRLLLAGQLRRGIGMGEIVLEYQPKFPLDGGRPRGVEALARWQHPDLGSVGPDGFIPLAEQAGLINTLTDVILDEAIAQCARWRDEGLTLRVSVNLSPPSLTDRELPRRIAELLNSHAVAPEYLQLEITESRAVPAGRGAIAVADELRQMGVSMAIDDFGTGFSSLVQLQRLPVDEIKIDRSFVATMHHNASDAAIVRSTIDLARNLGLHVTAEGVETADALAQLAAMGCELAQGYALCRPLSPQRCARAVREHLAPDTPTRPLAAASHVATSRSPRITARRSFRSEFSRSRWLLRRSPPSRP
jgi:diguanylate cyclase (GGDEF)-like protein